MQILITHLNICKLQNILQACNSFISKWKTASSIFKWSLYIYYQVTLIFPSVYILNLLTGLYILTVYFKYLTTDFFEHKIEFVTKY